jgi:hypothetical protein
MIVCFQQLLHTSIARFLNENPTVFPMMTSSSRVSNNIVSIVISWGDIMKQNQPLINAWKIRILVIDASLELNQPVIKYHFKDKSLNKVNFASDPNNQFIQKDKFLTFDPLLNMAE